MLHAWSYAMLKICVILQEDVSCLIIRNIRGLCNLARGCFMLDHVQHWLLHMYEQTSWLNHVHHIWALVWEDKFTPKMHSPSEKVTSWQTCVVLCNDDPIWMQLDEYTNILSFVLLELSLLMSYLEVNLAFSLALWPHSKKQVIYVMWKWVE
jgi:hypothetical protein